MVTNNIPRKTKARHATAQSPWPVLGSAAACVVVGLVFLVVLVAGVLMDAGAGLASDLGDESDVGAESSLGLFSSLCFPSLPGFVSPAGLPPAGSSVPGWVFPAGGRAPAGSITTRSATAPLASITQAVPKAPPAGVTNCADVSEPLSQTTSAMAPVAYTQEASMANWPSEAYTPKKRQSSTDPSPAATTCATPSRGPRHPARRRSAPQW